MDSCDFDRHLSYKRKWLSAAFATCKVFCQVGLSCDNFFIYWFDFARDTERIWQLLLMVMTVGW